MPHTDSQRRHKEMAPDDVPDDVRVQALAPRRLSAASLTVGHSPATRPRPAASHVSHAKPRTMPPPRPAASHLSHAKPRTMVPPPIRTRPLSAPATAVSGASVRPPPGNWGADLFVDESKLMRRLGIRTALSPAAERVLKPTTIPASVQRAKATAISRSCRSGGVHRSCLAAENEYDTWFASERRFASISRCSKMAEATRTGGWHKAHLKSEAARFARTARVARPRRPDLARLASMSAPLRVLGYHKSATAAGLGPD